MRPSGAQECPRGVQEPLCWSQHGMGWNEIDYSKFMSDPPTQEPQGLQNWSWRSQNRGRGRPREPRCTQKTPKTNPEEPKSVQEAPKKRSRAPMGCPRDAQEGPGDSKPSLKSSPARPGCVPDALGCVQGARGGPIFEKSVLRSLCERVLFCFFDGREKREP